MQCFYGAGLRCRQVNVHAGGVQGVAKLVGCVVFNPEPRPFRPFVKGRDVFRPMDLFGIKTFEGTLPVPITNLQAATELAEPWADRGRL